MEFKTELQRGERCKLRCEAWWRHARYPGNGQKVCFELLCSQIMDDIEHDDYDNLLECRYLFTKQVSRHHIIHLKYREPMVSICSKQKLVASSLGDGEWQTTRGRLSCPLTVFDLTMYLLLRSSYSYWRHFPCSASPLAPQSDPLYLEISLRVYSDPSKMSSCWYPVSYYVAAPSTSTQNPTHSRCSASAVNWLGTFS